MLKKEDFANDRVDAGDIGSGHTVTAFYEVEVIHPAHESPSDSLRYGHEHPAKPDYKGDAGQEWLHVKLRYKLPGEERSTLLEKPYVGVARPLQEAGIDFQFASSVAMAAMWLRDDESLRDTRPAMIADLAAKAAGTDADGKRMEFVRLMRKLNDGEPALRYRDR